MPELRIRVHQADTDRAFRPRVTGRTSLPAGQLTGDFLTVNVPDGTTEFTVTVEVATPDRREVSEQIVQAFAGSTDGRLRPLWAATNGAVRWTDRLHPRLSGTPLMPTGGKYPDLQLDLTFVDMTAVLAASASAHADYNPDYLRDPRNPSREDPHHGCLTYAFELTRAPVPKTWFLVVPPTLATQPWNPLGGKAKTPAVPDQRALSTSSFDVLAFFRPSLLEGYSRVEDTPVAGYLSRYLLDPPVFGPFFASRRVASEKARWHPIPQVGMEGQLARSRKRVLLAMPWPSGGGFGVASTSRLPGLLEDLVLAAYSLGRIGAANKLGATVGRLGLAGYSHGGGAAIKTWLDPTVRRRCSELYLFDANDVEVLLNNQREVQAWLREGNARVLRMIAALQLGRMVDLAGRIDPQWRDRMRRADEAKDPKKVAPPAVWCRPGGTDYWTGATAGSIFAWAFWPPPDPAHPRDRKTYTAMPPALAEQPAAGDLSSRSGVALTGPGSGSGTEVAAGSSSARARLDGISPAELAGFTGSFWLEQEPPPGTVRNGKDMAGFTRTASNLLRFGERPGAAHKADIGHGVRHQWAICGGDGDPTRGADFDGYFFQCLRDSRFAD